MNQNYTMDVLNLSSLNENGKLIIPSFQRGVVWSKAHRKDFIDTVKSGDPFGVILVWQKEKNQPYYLIDGLQRLSTLKAYMDNPLEFVDENDKFLDNSLLNNIIEAKYEHLKLPIPNNAKLQKESKQLLKNIIKILKTKKAIPDDATIIWPEICKIIGIDENSFIAIRAFSTFYTSFQNALKLPTDITIHAIVYTGEKDRLPSVFETLNTTSVSLTKYEVFSSQWPTKKITINDDELIKNVWKKYSDLKKSSTFEVEETEEGLKRDGITLFEYCFGLSEIIADTTKDYSFLFSKNKKSTDPTGFELLALACGLPVNKADDLFKEENLGNFDGLILQQLKNAIIRSISITASTLKKWAIDFNNAVLKNSSTYQIYYIIISVFKHLYKFDPKNSELELLDNKESKDWIKNFKTNAPKWYLYQILTDYWNQHRQVSDLRNLLNSDGNYDGEIIDYSSGIARTKWEEAISKYCENKDSLTGRVIPITSRLLLNYLYNMLIDEDNNRRKYFIREDEEGDKKTCFDIEHIIPFSKFEKLDIELPASALGNLCYLPVRDNRSKHDDTLYEYTGKRKSLETNDEFLELIDYPSEEELDSFISCNADQFEEPYLKFVEKREATLIDKFVRLIIKA